MRTVPLRDAVSAAKAEVTHDKANARSGTNSEGGVLGFMELLGSYEAYLGVRGGRFDDLRVESLLIVALVKV